MHEVQDRSDRDDRRDEERCSLPARAGRCECGDGQRDERRRHIDRLQPRGCVECVAERDLAHDRDRDTRLCVAEEAGAEAEQERCGQPLEASLARVEPQCERSREPDGEVPEERRRAVLRELVERQGLTEARTGQRRMHQVQPAARRERGREQHREGGEPTRHRVSARRRAARATRCPATEPSCGRRVRGRTDGAAERA